MFFLLVFPIFFLKYICVVKTFFLLLSTDAAIVFAASRSNLKLRRIKTMIQLNAVQRANPKDMTAARKYYVSTKSAGEVTLETLSEAISEKCTLTETDVLAVISALAVEMRANLMNGKIVRFGSFGSFQLVLNSTGVEKIEETSKNQVKNVKVRFRPGQKIQDGLKLLKFNVATKS